MVIGKAVKVPHVQNPAPEEIGKYLQLFIDGMQAIYEKHQIAAGYPHSKLVVMWASHAFRALKYLLEDLCQNPFREAIKRISKLFFDSWSS